MRKILFLLIALALGFTISAQHKQGEPKDTPCISEMISTLNNKQKRQIENIHKELTAQVEPLKRELNQVRDSVHYYMEQYGDYSSRVNRLMQKEANIQLRLNKLYYQAKVKTDKILSRKQFVELQNSMHQHRYKGKQHSKCKDCKKEQ